MMSKLLKIFLILVVMFPLWVTIMAFGSELESSSPSVDKWKNAINQVLLGHPQLKVQVTELLNDSRLKDLSDDLLEKKMKVQVSKINPRGLNKLAIRFEDDKGRLAKLVYVSAKLFVQTEVPVAIRDISKGSVVARTDIETRWVDASTLGRSPAKLVQIVGRQARQLISANSVIYSNQMESETLINKGERVSINVTGRGIQISAFGVALEPGAEGETIRILNSDSKKEIYAVITGENQAEVRL